MLRQPTARSAPRAQAAIMIWFGGKRPSPEQMGLDQANTLTAHVGIELVEIGDDFLTMRMPVDHRTHQPYGRLHGGASVVLAETVGSTAGNLCVDPTTFVVVGQEINANHIRPAYSGWVYGTARAEALGRTAHVWSIRIEDEAGKLVCISRFTAAVIAKDRK